MSKDSALAEALRLACAELREHNAEYGHRTDPARVEAWAALGRQATGADPHNTLHECVISFLAAFPDLARSFANPIQQRALQALRDEVKNGTSGEVEP